MSELADSLYVTCIKCAYVMTWIQHEHLRCSMPCPGCGSEEQFGPDVYVPGFKGYTMDEVHRQKARKIRRTS